MATYTFSAVETNVIGDSGVTIKEESTEGSLNLLLNSIGNTNYLIDSVCIWTDNPSQLDKVLFMDDIEVNGNIKSLTFIPYLDSKILQRQFCIDFSEYGGIKLNENTKFNYDILGNTNLTITFNITTNKILSIPNLIKSETGIDEFEDTREKMGVIEPEELSGFEKPKISEGDEPEEQKKAEAKANASQVTSFQESALDPLTKIWGENEKGEILSPKPDPKFALMQEEIDGKLTPPEISLLKMAPKEFYKIKSNKVLLIALGALGIWFISGKQTLFDEF